ncbi:MAG TPA: molybdopterin-binding protein [Burkholderiaceae bacterium]|nr:molybdopterin-binding protein [Burkholderiaceae bacterium]
MVSDSLPRFRLIIIGDEILSGRRQDKHFAKVVELLSKRGLSLHKAEIISDDVNDITATLKNSFATNDIVFCCGGVGGTPDDQTRQGAAKALNRQLKLHPEAEKLIAKRCAEMAEKGQGSADMSTPENQQRLQMGFFPEGAEIVPNAYNKIPGFYISNHTFTPGFPVMAWPMIEWTLDTRYKHLQHQRTIVEHSFLAFRLPESRIIPALEALEKQWPGVKAFSLPSVGDKGRPHLDLGVRGEPQAATEALAFLRAEVKRVGGLLVPPEQ